MALSLKQIDRALTSGAGLSKVSAALVKFRASPKGQALAKAAEVRKAAERAAIEKARIFQLAPLTKALREFDAKAADIDAKLAKLERDLQWLESAPIPQPVTPLNRKELN